MIAILAVTIASAVPPTRPAGPLRPASDPPSHNVGHVISPALLTPSVSLWLEEAGIEGRANRWLTIGTMAAVVVLKEVYDHRVAGNFSGKDLALGAAGVGIGLVITYRINP